VAKPLLQEARNSETIPKAASDQADSDMALMKQGNYPNSFAAYCPRRAGLRLAPFALALTMFAFTFTHAQTRHWGVEERGVRL
jgi:hypothetical protein